MTWISIVAILIAESIFNQLYRR